MKVLFLILLLIWHGHHRVDEQSLKIFFIIEFVRQPPNDLFEGFDGEYAKSLLGSFVDVLEAFLVVEQ